MQFSNRSKIELVTLFLESICTKLIFHKHILYQVYLIRMLICCLHEYSVQQPPHWPSITCTEGKLHSLQLCTRARVQTPATAMHVCHAQYEPIPNAPRGTLASAPATLIIIIGAALQRVYSSFALLPRSERITYGRLLCFGFWSKFNRNNINQKWRWFYVILRKLHV